MSDDITLADDRVTASRRTTLTGRDLPGPIEVEDISEESLRRRHEVHDIQLRPILLFGLSLVIAAVVIHLALWWLMRVWTDRPLTPRVQLPPAAVTPGPMQGPALHPFSASELEQLLSEQTKQTETYGWVDRQAGVVHIPIERAMQLLVERGLPARADAPTPTFGLSQAYELESEGGQVPIQANTAGVGEETPAATEEQPGGE